MLRIRLLPYISQISHPQLVSSALELNAGAIDATRFMTSGQPIQPSEITKTTSPLHAPFPNGATHEVDSNGIRKRKNRRSCAHRSRVACRATRRHGSAKFLLPVRVKTHIVGRGMLPEAFQFTSFLSRTSDSPSIHR